MGMNLCGPFKEVVDLQDFPKYNTFILSYVKTQSV